MMFDRYDPHGDNFENHTGSRALDGVSRKPWPHGRQFRRHSSALVGLCLDARATKEHPHNGNAELLIAWAPPRERVPGDTYLYDYILSWHNPSELSEVARG